MLSWNCVYLRPSELWCWYLFGSDTFTARNVCLCVLQLVQDTSDKLTWRLLLWVFYLQMVDALFSKPSFPMLILLHTGRQKVKDNYSKRFPYIALPDHYFQCITFGLLKALIFWILLKIAEILCSEGIFCLMQFLMLFLLIVLVPVFVWILWVWDAQWKHSC